MKAAVLQPMYLPWMGYFGMIDQVDTFIYYDDVQFVRRSWQRRNKIKIPGGDFTWLTVPVEKDFGQDINEVKVRSDENWQDSHWTSIYHSYTGAPYFDDYADSIKSLYKSEWESLLNLNISIIETILEKLSGVGGDTEFMYSSEIPSRGKKSDRLISILTEVGADSYVSGPGAKDYLEPQKFEQEGINVYWHEFGHPEYSQRHGDFVSHLSVIDLLFHVGDESGSIIKDTEQDALVPATD